jgi:hypothetical protein
MCQLFENVTLIEASHFDGVFDGCAVIANPGLAFATRDRHYVHINFWCCPAIQPEFFLAEVFSLLQCGEISKSQIDRLFDFIDEVTGKDDPGNVSFKPAKTLHVVVVNSGITEPVQEVRKGGILLFSG